jgi:hypothetical protein
MSKPIKAGAVLSLAALAAACEPGNLTEARDQLGRGGARVVEYLLPVVLDSAKVQDLVDTAETTLDTTDMGLLAIRNDPESLTVDVGDELQFENIDLDSFNADVTVPAGVNPGESFQFSVQYDLLASDTILEGVDTVEVFAGSMSVTTRNRLAASVDYTITFDGFDDASGQPLSAPGTVPAAPGDGSYVTDVLTVDLAGVTIVAEGSQILLDGVATVAPGGITPGLVTDAVVQFGSISTIEVEALAGTLDPAETEELTVDVDEESDAIDGSDFDFGDFEEAIEQSTLNDATVELEIDNSAFAPAVLRDFTIGLVKLDAFGNVPRDVLGNPIYERDSQNDPIVIPVTDPGETTLAVARSSVTTVSLEAAVMADALVHLVLDDEQVALVSVGTAEVGDGQYSRVSRSDSLGVTFVAVVGFDLTMPLTGVQISRNSVNDGIDVENAREADSLISRIDSPVEFTAELVNRTAFGTQIEVAFVGDSLPDDTDIFTWPGSVILDPITVAQPTVSAEGRVTGAVSDTVVVQLTNDDVRELLNEYFTAQARVVLLPGQGGGGRAAVQYTDAVLINSRIHIRLNAGKAP